MLPNRESGPQNQPKEKVAVSVLAGIISSIGGILGVVVVILFSPLFTFWLQLALRLATTAVNDITINRIIKDLFIIFITYYYS